MYIADPLKSNIARIYNSLLYYMSFYGLLELAWALSVEDDSLTHHWLLCTEPVWEPSVIGFNFFALFP